MIKILQSGPTTINIGNSKYQGYIQVFQQKCDRPYIFDVIADQIFQSVDQETFYKLVAWLLISDEWANPINKITVDCLFFALCNNSQNKRNIIITNMSQAYMLYKETENDYRELQYEEAEEDHKVAFERHFGTDKYLLDGFKFGFKIPVRYIGQKKNGKKITWRMLDFKVLPEYLYMDGSSSQVSWDQFKYFFVGHKHPVGKLGVTDGEKIGSLFNFNAGVFIEILKYVGFHQIKDFDMDYFLDLYNYVVEDHNQLRVISNKRTKKAVVDLAKDFDHPEFDDFFRDALLSPMRDFYITCDGQGRHLVRL